MRSKDRDAARCHTPRGRAPPSPLWRPIAASAEIPPRKIQEPETTQEKKPARAADAEHGRETHPRQRPRKAAPEISSSAPWQPVSCAAAPDPREDPGEGGPLRASRTARNAPRTAAAGGGDPSIFQTKYPLTKNSCTPAKYMIKCEITKKY